MLNFYKLFYINLKYFGILQNLTRNEEDILWKFGDQANTIQPGNTTWRGRLDIVDLIKKLDL